MLLQIGPLLRLGPNVITDGAFITLGSSYHTCAFYILSTLSKLLTRYGISWKLYFTVSLMTSFSRQKPLKSKIQKHTIVGNTKFYYRAKSHLKRLKIEKTSFKEITFWWQLTRRDLDSEFHGHWKTVTLSKHWRFLAFWLSLCFWECSIVFSLSWYSILVQHAFDARLADFRMLTENEKIEGIPVT